MTDLKNWLAPFGIEAPHMQVNDVKADSRDILPGDVFVATEGLNQNGVAFIGSAIANGAAAVLVDKKELVDRKDQTGNAIAIDDLQNVLPKLLAAFYYHSAKIKKIGVTGTNGKTTISQLIAQLAKPLAQKVSVIGTMGVGTLDNLVDINNTTPGLANNYRLLDQFAKNGSQFVAMEVSSQGLHQQRVTGIAFDCVIFTNLTQDHLDYHGSLDSYAAAKKVLFDSNKTATTVLNIDDATGKSWLEQWRNDRNVVAVGRYDEKFTELKHVMFKDIQYTAQGLAFNLTSNWGQAKVVSPLFGQFNLNNLVSAMASLLSFGFSPNDLVDAVKQLKAVPGRMEQFSSAEDKSGVVAIVDYAHTPDALAQALQALKGHVKGRLWCIFGCGGDRDKSKRPLMAKMAERYADQIVITNDNPRNEPPLQIIDDIQAGLQAQDNVRVEPDRKQAIVQTLTRAEDGDIVLIAGKGHETYQIVGDDVLDYDERRFVRQFFIGKAGTKACTSEEMA